MEADIIFADPDDPDREVAMLIKHGFEVEVLERWTDYYSADDEADPVTVQEPLDCYSSCCPAVCRDWPQRLRKVWIMARIPFAVDDTTTRDPQLQFLDWMMRIVEPLGGDLSEAGFADPATRRNRRWRLIR
jgi:hypothetical protein